LRQTNNKNFYFHYGCFDWIHTFIAFQRNYICGAAVKDERNEFYFELRFDSILMKFIENEGTWGNEWKYDLLNLSF
jgi:hypothetical protein